MVMKKKYSNFIVVIIFAFLSCMFSLYFIRTGGMVLTSDSSFHISRVEEIYRNLKEGKVFTFIAAHTFSNSGVGNFMFYPTLFLYPWALLRFVFNPVTSFYLWYGLFLFLTMVIAYYSMLSYSSSKVRSYAFSLVYSLAAYHIHLGTWNYVLGEFTAYTFIPLAFLGIYHILFGDSRKWKILSCGMALIMYSHLLSVYITAMILVLITVGSILYKKGISKERIISLVKSGVLALLLVCPQLILFITDYIGHDIAAPQKSFAWTMTVMELLEPSLNNTSSINRSVGIIIIITAFIGWYFVKNREKERNIYIIGIIFLCLATKLTPWDLLSKTFVLNIIGQIQFPYRFNMYSSLFLSITASLVVQRIVTINNSYYSKFWGIAIMTMLMVLNYGSIVTDTVTRIYTGGINLEKNTSSLVALPKNVYVSKNNYVNIFSYLVLFGETDYYHKQSFDNNDINSNKNAQTIVNHDTYFNNKKIASNLKKVNSNSITYLIKNTKEGYVDFPVIKYKNTHVKVNGNEHSSTISNRGTVQVKLTKGINLVEIYYQPIKLFFLGVLISCSTWIVLVYSYFRNWIKD